MNCDVRNLNDQGAVPYIAERLGIPAELIRASNLGGGVSNNVVLIQAPATRLVLKQSLGQLRVEQEWLSDRGRIFAEALAMRELRRLLSGCLPEIVFEDPEQFAFAMTAAPAGAEMWKTLLLGGHFDARVAKSVGEIHGRLIAGTWDSREMRERFGDQTVFDQLRLDAYYRFTAGRHPDLFPQFEQAIRRCGEEARCLVHGDWSPKNLLVDETGVTVIDFEVIHFGDPAFDSAFLLNHLLLKAFYRPGTMAEMGRLASVYWDSVRSYVPAADWFQQGTLSHLPLLMLARVDGKSPAEYITEPSLKERIRQFARDLVSHPAATISEVFQRLQ